MQEIKLPPWRKAAIKGTAVIQIDPSARFQEILGFGAAFTDASCYLLSELAPEKRQALLPTFWGRRGCGSPWDAPASGRAIIRAIRTAMTTARIPIRPAEIQH